MTAAIGTPTRTVTLANGSEVAALGQGTWHVGDPATRTTPRHSHFAAAPRTA